MDPKELEAKMQEARDAGYSEEEIQNYLANKQTPIEDLRNQPTMDRHEQNVGMGQAAGGLGAENLINAGEKVIEYGAPAYGAYKAIQHFRGGPVAPTTTQPAVQPNVQQLQTAVNGGRPNLQVQTGGQGPVEPTKPLTYEPPTAMPEAAQTSRAASLAEQGMAYAKQMRDIAAQFAKANAMKLGVGAGLAAYSPSLNANEEQELARRRAMGYQ